MIDPRLTALAHNLLTYSVHLKKGERVLLEMTGIDSALTHALIDEAYALGAQPFVWLRDPSVERVRLMGLNEAQADLSAEVDGLLMSKMDAYVGVRGGDNSFEMGDVPAEKHEMYMKHYWSKVHGELRVGKTRWVVLRYPSPSMAQMAGMSTEAFEDYYFNVCCLDYGRMSRAMDALVERMERTDRVHLMGPGTDLTFSIKGLPAIKCAGDCNIPDGEVFTAPVKDSVNGVLSYNAPSLHQGFTFENISLTFENGKIIKATANDTERINKVFDVDEGARYVGEFAIGVNPYVTDVMKDTLFDEKIAGSFHFTPGSCYEECDNGNQSALHWDLVNIQTPEMGGGEIWFDDELIRKDGLFVPSYLHSLNPENLK